MKKELKDKWVAALCSGNYKQGAGCLKDSKGQHCCLGVLCDIIDPLGWEGLRWDGLTSILYYYKLQEIGLELDSQGHLTDMNDGNIGIEPKGFVEIADWIKVNVREE